MSNLESKSIKYSWHAGINSGGSLSLMLTIPESVSKEIKVEALASGIAESVKAMRSKGYLRLRPETRFMASTDLSETYGFTRQYWEKLLKEGKILYKETAAGMITTDMWVDGYLGDKQRVSKYAKNCKIMATKIKELKRRYGTTTCIECNTVRFEYNKNMWNTNGLCRNCGFRIEVTERNRD